jgi:hypothetical protein
MVDADNTAAVAAYRRAGMSGRKFGAAATRDTGHAVEADELGVGEGGCLRKV